MNSSSDIYQLKITLRHTKPPVWRRVQVSKDLTLAAFNGVIQVAMGWTNSHLHQFLAGGKRYGELNPEEWVEYEDERKVRLSDLLRKRKDRMVYEYDFGDNWQHDILLEDVLPADAGVRYPLAVTGRRACPPEDCGGVYGYYHFLDALQNPAHPDHEDMTDWWGDQGFDPDAFDLQETNHALRGD